MNKLCLASVLLLALPLSACGDNDAGGDDDAPMADAAPGTPDAADNGDWLVLNEGSWTIEPGTEPYFCIIKTIQEDTYIKSFKGLTPPGTHHTVLTIYEGNEPDGMVPCTAGKNGQNMIFGTGVGTPEMNLPPGVAVKLTAGQRILNNLHLYNVGESAISGTSGTLYKPMPPAELEHEAELVLAGTVSFTATSANPTVSGNCNISNVTDEPINVFAISPHMHQRGRHVKSTIIRGAEQIVIQDTDYDFDQQVFTMQNPFIQLLPGDVLKTECTYELAPGESVSFGDSSDQEMCFTDIFYFPKQGAPFVCASFF